MSGVQFLILTISTTTIFITVSQTPVYTTVLETTTVTTTINSTATTTITPSYVNDTNVITQDIVTIILLAFAIAIVVYVNYRHRLGKKLKIANNHLDYAERIATTLNDTIKPT